MSNFKPDFHADGVGNDLRPAERELGQHPRVIARDTAAASRMTAMAGEGAISIPEIAGPAGNEVAWLKDARPVYASYTRGAFRGALGKVLGTEELGQELRQQLADPNKASAGRRSS